MMGQAIRNVLLALVGFVAVMVVLAVPLVVEGLARLQEALP